MTTVSDRFSAIELLANVREQLSRFAVSLPPIRNAVAFASSDGGLTALSETLADGDADRLLHLLEQYERHTVAARDDLAEIMQLRWRKR